MRARLAGVFGAAAIAAGCSGPPAPDAAICRDVIHRLCLPQRCTAVTLTLEVNDSCEADLLARTHCSRDDFEFPDPPGRDRVLDCRLPLLREGLGSEQHPACPDVTDMLEVCPDLVAWLKEGP
ncbi:MAG TPA: hypothetical protein VIG99_05015 [Myxococcaceae bacterium]|jgi:hypothetical protein